MKAIREREQELEEKVGELRGALEVSERLRREKDGVIVEWEGWMRS